MSDPKVSPESQGRVQVSSKSRERMGKAINTLWLHGAVLPEKLH